MSDFDYDAPAELYVSSGKLHRRPSATYRRFERSAEAIRFTVEVLEPQLQRRAAMEVGDQRFEYAQIFGFYTSDAYPLSRAVEGQRLS
jgi:hypothetical protein